MRSSLLGSLFVVSLLSGCSLVMDTSPPDPTYTAITADAGPVPCSHDADCDDGDACTGVESCGATGYCVGGQAVVCPSVGCAIGECHGDGQCKVVPTDALCDDAADCTADACQDDGVCRHTADDTQCDDGIACTKDICLGVAIGNLHTGCYGLPQDNRCTQPSNTVNACAAFVCAPSAAPDDTGCAIAPNGSCATGMRCNFDTFACEHLPEATCDGCDDGNPCNGIETCLTNGTAETCTRADNCTRTQATCQRTVCDQHANDPANDVCVDVRKYDTSCLAPIVGVTPGG